MSPIVTSSSATASPGRRPADTLRKADASARITILADEPYPLYNRIALPRVLKQTTLPERTIIRQVAWHAQNDIDLRLETTVAAVDTAGKTLVTTAGRNSPTTSCSSPAGTPNHLRVPGAAGVGGIYNFQTLDDTKAILARTQSARAAVTLGGSFIAYELTEAFRHRNIPTTWLVRPPLPAPHHRRGRRGWSTAWPARWGWRPTTGSRRSASEGRGGGGHHREREALPERPPGGGDRAHPAHGVPAGTPVTLGRLKGVQTNEYLETGVPDVYAAGDVAEFFDVYIGSHNQMGTWNNAPPTGARRR